MRQMDRSALKSVRSKYRSLARALDERQRRLWAATEARALGRGGVALVVKATGLAKTTVLRGLAELAGGPPQPGRVRRVGGGRKNLLIVDPGLIAAMEALVEPATRGDPESPLRWTSKSTRHLARELTAQGHPISHTRVAQLLEAQGGRYENPEFLISYHAGNALHRWYNHTASDGIYRRENYLADFFDPGPGMAALEQRLAAIAAAGDTWALRGFFWFQGEGDSGYDSLTFAYEERFKAMVAAIKADAGWTGELPLGMTLIWGSPAVLSAGDCARVQIIRDAQRHIAEQSFGSIYVDSEPYARRDQWHLTVPALGQLGRTMGDAFLNVPEPSSALLAAVSAAVFAGLSRRRR